MYIHTSAFVSFEIHPIFNKYFTRNENILHRKQGTSLLNNSSQTVEIKDKTNEKKPYLEQNISNHKLDR